MQLFLAPECLPFAIASVMLIVLTAIEMLCLLLGFSLSETIDKAWAGDHGGMAGLMSWLNIGGVPLLVLLMLGLGLFAISGFVIQAVAASLWSPLPAAVAAIPAAVLTVPTMRMSSRWVARIVPRDESYAVETTEFIGRSGEVTVGPLDQGLPGRVRLKDQHGNWHILRARAARNEAPIPIGAQVLLVDHVSNVFIAISAPSDLLTPPNP
ncbi:OB-fold-containig protein [Rhizobium sp. RU36D]|uniref:OB-fold-containig protein n=1 Tax=Rhizobium sp. RU36D TaxID=1907415 RepID=UPI0009D84361|nr:OB-fold-containig protein [Rhizobium sp. RU36D]SMC76488.1 Membrane protein implicated in regulation of membrane protease activity [Rhizobium sp. RU36D]